MYLNSAGRPHDDSLQTHDGGHCGNSRGQSLSFAGQRHLAGADWQHEVQTRVRLDLNAARAAYNNHIELISRSSGRRVAGLIAGRRPGRRSPRGNRPLGWSGSTRRRAWIFVVVLDRQRQSDDRAGKIPASTATASPIISWSPRRCDRQRPLRGSLILSADRLRREGRGPGRAGRIHPAADAGSPSHRSRQTQQTAWLWPPRFRS